MKKTRPRKSDTDLLESLNLTDLSRFCGVETRWVVELVEYGVLEPRGTSPEKWMFRGANIVRARKARRLTHDLGMNIAGVAMVLDLLDERDRLRHRLSRYETI